MDDEGECGGAVAPALVPGVDEQLPQEVRATQAIHRFDVPREHDETDGDAVVQDGSGPWVRLRDGRRLGQ